MPTKSKIAYLMHVDWNWIKQRPHFLYEELTKYYHVDLFYVDKLFNKDRNKNSYEVYSNSKVNKFKKIPLSGRFRALQYIEKFLNSQSIHLLNNYDYIWITSPLMLDFISLDQVDNKIVIYDCMDNFLGFYEGTNKVDRLKPLEIALIKRSDFVFCSSGYLKHKIISLYRNYLRSDPIVINNGISSSLYRQHEIVDKSKIKENAMINLTYIGTIGEWIDFNSLIKVLDNFPNVTFTMIGPVDVKVPEHSRINFIGVVRHNELVHYASKAHALIMPFKLTELVRAVDPVKIYEYIYFNKPILAINYEEMYKFLPFVNLYNNDAQLISLVNKIINEDYMKFSKEHIFQFLNKNTWNLRCKSIVRILKGEAK